MKKFRTAAEQETGRNIADIFAACPDPVEIRLENFPKYVRRYLGSRVNVRFIRPPEGRSTRSFTGVLAGMDDGRVTLTMDDGDQLVFDRNDAAYIKLFYDFDAEAEDAPDMGGHSK